MFIRYGRGVHVCPSPLIWLSPSVFLELPYTTLVDSLGVLGCFSMDLERLVALVHFALCEG